MKILGIIIGTSDEPVTKKYYRENKSSLKILEEYDVFSEHIPYDFAIFAEIKRQGELKHIEVIPLFGDELTLEDCNECDYIFSIFEGVYSFMDGGSAGYKNYMNVLKKTTATVYPSQKMQQFIIEKHKYMKYLGDNKYKIPPTKFIDLSRISINPIMKFINKEELSEIIIKPELGAFKTGFKIIKKPTEKKVSDYLDKLKKQGYKRILLQPFISEFNKYGEIKTYWVDGKFVYAYKQQWKDGSGVFQHQDKIDKVLLRECLITASELLEDIFKDHEELVQCRIDFACCMNNDKRCREFFINEIEISPTIGSDKYELDGKGYSLLAKALLKKCK